MIRQKVKLKEEKGPKKQYIIAQTTNQKIDNDSVGAFVYTHDKLARTTLSFLSYSFFIFTWALKDLKLMSCIWIRLMYSIQYSCVQSVFYTMSETLATTGPQIIIIFIYILKL